MKKALVLFLITMSAGRLLAQSPKQQTLNDLLKKLQGIEVNADGSITVKGKPATKIKIHDSTNINCDILTNIAADSAAICMDSPQCLASDTVKYIPNTQTAFADKINEVDDYGDQVPHFVYKDPANAYVSRSFGRNVAATVGKLE